MMDEDDSRKARSKSDRYVQPMMEKKMEKPFSTDKIRVASHPNPNNSNIHLINS